MVDSKNVRLVLEWEDLEGKPQSLRWEIDAARLTYNENRNITPDHLELLKTGTDVKARATLDVKLEYTSTVKADEKKVP